MKINLAGWDRALRVFLGFVLLAWAVAGGPWWAYLGLVLLATAAWRFCPIYGIFKLQTYRGPRPRKGSGL